MRLTEKGIPNIFRQYFFISLVALIFIFSFFLQSNLLLNVDVSWLLEASKRMLQGGTYTKDYFENNPPWILYFYAPIILIEKLFFIKLISAARIYFYLLAAFSLWLSHSFMKKIILKEDYFVARLFTIVLALLFVVLPLFDFGQREHLLFIMTMPYFLMVVLRLQEKPINTSTAVIVGIMSGSVFILKPYFLFTLALTEAYFILSKKSRIAWLRPEIIPLVIMLLGYAWIILFRHSDYLTLVVPFALRLCYLGSKMPFFYLGSNSLISLCVSSILLFLVTYEINRYKQLTIIMLLALLGFLFSYFIQGVDYPYRIYPAFSMGLCLSVFLFWLYVSTPNKNKNLLLLFSSYAIFSLTFTVPIFHDVAIKTAGLFYCVAGIIFLIAYLVMSASCSWQKKASHFLVSMIGLLLLLVPVYYSYSKFLHLKTMKKKYISIINYLDDNALHQSVYMFSTNLSHSFPVITYTKDTISASRFSGFWMLSGLVKQSYSYASEKQLKQRDQDANFLLNMVAEDIVSKKPKLILVDALDHKAMLFSITKNGSHSYINFDYLPFLKMNSKLSQEFENYRYKTTLETHVTQNINIFSYKLKLESKGLPINNEIISDTLYLYFNNQAEDLEIAFVDLDNEIRKDHVKLNNNSLAQIKQIFANPERKLNKQDMQVISSLLSKQEIIYSYYKFNVYERL